VASDLKFSCRVPLTHITLWCFHCCAPDSGFVRCTEQQHFICTVLDALILTKASLKSERQQTGCSQQPSLIRMHTSNSNFFPVFQSWKIAKSTWAEKGNSSPHAEQVLHRNSRHSRHSLKNCCVQVLPTSKLALTSRLYSATDTSFAPSELHFTQIFQILATNTLKH